MNSKTLYDKRFYGIETLNQMPRLIYRVVCAYLFDYSDDLGLSQNDRLRLLAADVSGRTGVFYVASILRRLEVTFIRVEKHSYPDQSWRKPDYYTTIYRSSMRIVNIS